MFLLEYFHWGEQHHQLAQQLGGLAGAGGGGGGGGETLGRDVCLLQGQTGIWKMRPWRGNKNFPEKLWGLTLSHVQPDGVAGGVGRGAGVVPRVLWPGLVDGEGGHRGVGRRHPERLPALLPQQVGGDAHPGGEVDHAVIVVPEQIWQLDS